ncbi:hypothetical protein ACTFIT_003933 [Dictyostelium discoideum]
MNKLLNIYFNSIRPGSYLFPSISIVFLTPALYVQDQLNFGLTFYSIFTFYVLYYLGSQWNTYLDYITGVDNSKSDDKTLFGVMSLGELKIAMALSVIINYISIGVLYFYLKFIELQSERFGTIVLINTLLIIVNLLYTPLKYIVIGQFSISLTSYVFTLLITYINSGVFSFFDSNDPIHCYSLLFHFSYHHCAFANCLRDLKLDKESGIITITILFGEFISKYYYVFCFFVTYYYLFWLSGKFGNIWLFLVPLLILPFLFIFCKGFLKNGNYQKLNLKTFKLYYLFGFAMLIGIIIGGKK